MKPKGFTLLEMLLALAILGLVITITTISFTKLNASQALDKSATLVVSILDEARSLTLSSKNDIQYGVHLEAAQVTLFKGPIYSPSDSDNVVTSLHSFVSLRNINLSGGGVDVVFRRLTGNTNNTGTFEIFLNDSPTTFHTITIGATGIVE